MHELFEISLETFNLIQLSEWIKKCRSAIKLSDNLSYTENPCRYQEEVSAFCESYIDFLEKNKPIVNSKLFEPALKLSVIPKPRYFLVSKEQIEIDVTVAMEELQLANQITSNLFLMIIYR